MSADVEGFLIPWLAAQTGTRVVTDIPADLTGDLPLNHLVRIGGGADDNVSALEMPTVSIDSYGVDRAAAVSLAGRVDAAIRKVLPGTLHAVTGGTVVVLRAQTMSGPSWRPYEDIATRRFGATYRLIIRSR